MVAVVFNVYAYRVGGGRERKTYNPFVQDGTLQIINK